MKKIIILIVLVFTLMGCKPANYEEITMMIPFGSTQLAQLHMQNNTDDYIVDVVQGPTPLVAAFGSVSHDVIVAPINLGAKMYQSSQDYVLLAVIGWGSFYLISETKIDDITDLQGKDIVAFGQNSTPGVLLRHLLAEKEVTANITYVDSVATVAATFVKDTTTIILVAEPVLSNLKNKGFTNISILDLQEIYGSIHQTTDFPAAAVFVRKDLDSKVIEKIAQDFENSITKVNQDVSAAATLAVSLEMGLPYEVIVSSLPASNIRFVSAQESKDEIILFLEMLMEFNSALIGGMLPQESFYHQG